MRSIILSVTALFLSVASFGQYATPPDYFREVSINVGISPFSQPSLTKYYGDKKNLPLTYSVNMHYNFTEHFQVGADLNMSRWEGSGEQQYNAEFGQPSEVRKTTYLYADKAWALTARANYVIPSYDDWHVNRSNFYFGVAVGAMFTVNDGSLSYGELYDKPYQNYRYLSQYNYNSGSGYVLGIQVGYTQYFNNHFGVNFEAAPRYTHVYVLDSKYDHANHDFELWYYPITIGLKFRF
jgi:hypothetical protein